MSGRWDGPELTGQIDPKRSLGVGDRIGKKCPIPAVRNPRGKSVKLGGTVIRFAVILREICHQPSC